MEEFHAHNHPKLKSVCIFTTIYFIFVSFVLVVNTGYYTHNKWIDFTFYVLLLLLPLYLIFYLTTKIKDDHKEDLRKSFILCNDVFYHGQYKESHIKDVIRNASREFSEYYNVNIPKWYQMGLSDYTKECTRRFTSKNFLYSFFKLYPNATDYYYYEIYKMTYSENSRLPREKLKADSFAYNGRTERTHPPLDLGYFRFENMVYQCKYTSLKSRNFINLTSLMKDREELCLYYKEIKERYKSLVTVHQCVSCKFDNDSRTWIHALKNNEFYNYNKFISDLHLDFPKSIQSLKDLKFDFDKIYSPLLIALAQYEKEYKEQQTTYLSIVEKCPFGASKYKIEHTNDEGDIEFVKEWQKEIEKNEQQKPSIIQSYIAKDELAYKKFKEDEKRAQEEAQRQKAIEDQKKKEKEQRQQKEFDDAMEKYNRNYEEFLSNKGKSIGQFIHECKLTGIRSIGNVPHEFLYYYYPRNREFVPQHSIETRDIVYGFKDGISYEKPLKQISKIINKEIARIKDLMRDKYYEPSKPYRNAEGEVCFPNRKGILHAVFEGSLTDRITEQLTFVCIPASSQSTYVKRCQNFSKEICKATHIQNGFEDNQGVCNLRIESSKGERHLGDHQTTGQVSYNAEAFKGKNIILFDDIVTKGETAQKYISLLESLGATVEMVISIGYTYPYQAGELEAPHPTIRNAKWVEIKREEYRYPNCHPLEVRVINRDDIESAFTKKIEIYGGYNKDSRWSLDVSPLSKLTVGGLNNKILDKVTLHSDEWGDIVGFDLHK